MYLSLGDLYYRFNKRTVQVDSGYPRKATEAFLICPTQNAIENIKDKASGDSRELPFGLFIVLTVLTMYWRY